MFVIKKLRADHVIDFAAEELKEYLRMMMPRCGEIAISYEPGATDGFRLGLWRTSVFPVRRRTWCWTISYILTPT